MKLENAHFVVVAVVVRKKKTERFDIAKTPRANSIKRWRSMAGGEGRVKKKQGAGSFRQRACVFRIIL